MTEKKSFDVQLEEHFLAGAPAIYIQSAEEARVDQLLNQLKDKAKLKRIHEWNLGYGWVDVENKRPLSNLDSSKTELEHALLALLEADLEQSLIVIKGARLALENNTLAVARLKQLLNSIERNYAGECSVILVSEAVCIPAPIEAQVTLLPLPLPSRAEIKTLLAEVESRGQLTVPDHLSDLAVSGLSGLTSSEMAQLLRMVGRETQTLDEKSLNTILHEKEQIIVKSGVLEMVRVDVSVNDIGGLENLKQWLEQRSTIIRRLDEATSQGVKTPKGVLIAGMPGCGKSLTAKVAAGLFQLPLLRLDIGSLLGKYVGESEHNMRRALSMAETVSPCILWVDELEKAFVGMGGGNASEVTARLLGYFLTWMQEKTGAVFVIATANDITALPPELLRKGRFDEIFYVGFPNPVEREKILGIHLGKSGQRVADLRMDELVNLCRDYCGADIENSINEAVANAFISAGALTQQHLEDAIRSTIPLRETLRDQVGKYEELFEKLKLRPASEYQGLSVAQMIKMAADPNHVKREEVARNPDCPGNQLEKLSMDAQRSVAEAVYANPRCPEHVLSIRLNLPEDHPQYDVSLFKLACLNGNAPQDLLMRLIDEGILDDELRASLAACITGEALQTKLASDRLDSVAAGLIMNPSLLPCVRSKLLHEGKSSIKQALVKDPELTEPEQQLLLTKASSALKSSLATHPRLSVAVQMILAKDSHQAVREKLAGNIIVVREAQQILAEDSCYPVKQALAGNPGLCLGEDEKLKLRKFITENRHLGGERYGNWGNTMSEILRIHQTMSKS